MDALQRNGQGLVVGIVVQQRKAVVVLCVELEQASVTVGIAICNLQIVRV